jgi:FixJ family two-component response regulator
MSREGTVFIVDDDPAVRDALTSLFEAAGLAVEAYPDAESFLAIHEPCRSGCLVLDIKMSGMGGLGLQAMLAERKDYRPIIFLTGYGTVKMAAHAFRDGAFDFVEKPIEGEALLALVHRALQRDAKTRQKAAERNQAQLRCATLTRRECEILQLLAAGASSKDIGRKLNISHRTVESHRKSIMLKTGAKNLIALLEIAKTGGLLLNPPAGDGATRS